MLKEIRNVYNETLRTWNSNFFRKNRV